MTGRDPGANLGRPELAVLWKLIRKRLENNGLQITAVPLKLKGLDDAEIVALCALLGRRRPSGNDLNVDLRALERTLLDSPVGLGLTDTLEQLGAPLRDRKAERFAKSMARHDLWLLAGGHPATADQRIVDWLAKMRRIGRLTRFGEDQEEVLASVLDALDWLLTNAETLRNAPLPLSMIAAVQVGDAHALDLDTSVGALLTDALADIGGSHDVRAAWAGVGIQLDQVSTSALALNLPGVDGSICAAAGASGQPLRITWRMVEQGFGLDLDSIRHSRTRVRICENPAIVTLAADRFGSSSDPLICTEGMPASVTAALLTRLAEAGGDLTVHADFDFGGIAIVRYVTTRFDATPWRMGEASYLRAIEGPTSPLDHKIGPTTWDPALADAMNQYSLAVHEEAIASTLLDDLTPRD